MSWSGSFRMRYVDVVQTQDYGSEMITLLRTCRLTLILNFFFKDNGNSSILCRNSAITNEL